MLIKGIDFNKCVVGRNKPTKKSIAITGICINNDTIQIPDTEFYVYAHKRGDNNEIFYIGKGNKKRCIDTNNRNFHWINIVNKYNYYVEILYNNLSEEDAFKIEAELISKYGRLDNKTGLLVNMTDGGEGSKGIKFTDEWKKNKSISMTGNKNHMFNKRFYGDNNPNYGNRGKNNSLSKAIVALDFNGNLIKEYDCIKNVIIDGYIPSIVSNCCNHKRSQTMNTQFLFKSEYDNTKEYKYIRGKTSVREVVQIDMNNNFINYYECINDVKNDGFSPKVVQKVCSGKSKSYLGYKWIYFDNLNDVDKNQIKSCVASKI